MTPAQFDIIARLLRSRGMSRQGCHLVLVEGMRQCDAARTLDCSPTLIAVSLRHYRDAYQEIIAAFVTALL